MLLPGFALVLIFNYGPMYGLLMAFQDFQVTKGIWGSPWVGLKHFEEFFRNPMAVNALRNTLLISALKLIFGFPAPILLALLFNELRDGLFKRASQTISYMPHFVSWIVFSALVTAMLSPSTGVVNQIIKLVGLKPIYFMANPPWFRVVLVASEIWKEIGWGAIIYLAALTDIDPTLYEAAVVDGATRLQRMLYISIPSVLPIAALLLILRLGGVLSAGFDQVFNMYNATVYETADIIDTFVYRSGLTNLQYSFAAAVGFFKSVVGLVLVLAVNEVARRLSDRYYALW
ncbi:MAG: sugar ABC transporter permease [Chloroflexi bacterium]|nr:sugar ABC transporter permease [Chloroflexota bacterium]